MLVTFTLQQKTSKNKTKTKNTKKMQPYDRKFVVKKNINRFRFIMTPTRGKDP